MDAGQEAAFEVFVREHGTTLLRVAVLLVGDRGHAEDLLQSALERTAHRWEHLEGPPIAFARTVMVNLATDRWRRRKVRVQEVTLPVVHDVASSEQATDQVDLWHSVSRALRQLPNRQRAVMVLRYYADLSEVEIAQTLGVSVGTVKNTSSQARARLRLELDHEESVR